MSATQTRRPAAAPVEIWKDVLHAQHVDSRIEEIVEQHRLTLGALDDLGRGSIASTRIVVSRERIGQLAERLRITIGMLDDLRPMVAGRGRA